MSCLITNSLFLLFFLSSLFQCLSFTPNGSLSYHTKPICTAQQIPSFFFSSSQPHLQSKPLSLATSSDTFNLIQPTDLRPEKDDDATKRTNHLQRSNCINRVTCTTYWDNNIYDPKKNQDKDIPKLEQWWSKLEGGKDWTGIQWTMTGSSIEVVVCGLDFSDEEGGAKSELHQWCQCNWVSDIF